MPEPITLLDLDAAGLDLTQPAPPEFIAFLRENAVGGYVTLWSTLLDEDGFRVIWPWLNAADELQYPQYRLNIQFVEPPTEVKPSGAHVTEITYSSAPAWVPSGAKIHIDFLGGTPQGRAWVDGTGEVAIETLLPDFNTILSPGEGYRGGGLDYFGGAALAFVLGSFTGRLQYFWPEGATMTENMDDAFFTSDATNNYALQLSLDFPLGRVRLQGYNEIDLRLLSAPLNQDDGDINVVAFTITTVADGGRAEFALNGSAVTSGVYDTDDRPAANPFNIARTSPKTLALQYITFYDPLPTTAGLSALSEV